ncbi:nucleoside hydrolase [Nostoc linckia z18]|uniref:Nucleoside hydrolase n=2 Tax=Nostoc linckia TaxID=92942 RepID=A0A9Q5Z7Z9_NOSLI|nr:nucleoside hydrolase [Nostoc linckia]PHK34692.1 nucleoside hydrolase [Nostoc linckia z15]PHK41563.1 nucleoside hydrolase [Nostoc linckia z16]PHJ58718.1 nucleoside hydrolase [Nostoc linckia z1]PHJ60182.1 nucleoside hydrolase [Nostoc linckia z2]PHJ64050.1 nucleoside hydrolase [Nostoc linckia z3]
MSKQLVLMDHDGGVDDYLATMLLLTMDNIQLLGVVVTPADCYIQPAVSATRKILDLMGFSHIPIAQSTVRGINPFPNLYRRDSFIVDHLPILNQRETITTPLVAEPGQDFMIQVLREASDPVTLMVTGPLTTVAAALEKAPDIEAKIQKIVWMGGALNVPGNVEKSLEPGQDGSAEWNVYWDAISAAQVWKTQIEIIMCPLDLTNNVPVTSELVQKMGRQRHYPASDLAGQCYALVIPQDYYFWDVLATAYLGHPEFYQLREWETEIITTGVSQGRTKVVSGGRKIYAMDKVDKDAFYAYILQQWAR